MTFGGPRIFEFLSNDVNAAITAVVTGRDTNAYDDIDRSLAYMQVALSSIDSLDVGQSEIVNEAKNRNLWFTGIGIAGPAITGGAMLLLNKVAMALVIGLGPMFILCLLFAQTNKLFSKWLFYGIGRSEEHTSELQSLMRISYAVFCLKKKKLNQTISTKDINHLI